MGEATAKRERTCIGCGAKAGKAQLHRIVRLADGDVRFDATGRAAGRGAYVCSTACLEKAMSAGKLQRALRTQVADATAERISCRIAEEEVQGKTA